jgi:hypothetical protein
MLASNDLLQRRQLGQSVVFDRPRALHVFVLRVHAFEPSGAVDLEVADGVKAESADVAKQWPSTGALIAPYCDGMV